MKRFVSFLLITAMLCAVLPFSAISVSAHGGVSIDSQGIEYNLCSDGTCYAAVHCDGSAASVVIPSRVDGLPVIAIGDYAFSDCTSLESIEIPESIISIGNYAFSFWTSEQTIYCRAESQPDGWSEGWAELCDANIVWGYKKEPEPDPGYTDSQGVEYIIGYGETFYTVLYFGGSATSVVIPDEINGLPVKKIGDYAFSGRPNLESIVIPRSVTNIGEGAFSDCPSLEISVDADNQAYSLYNGILFNKNKTELICYPAGKTETTYVIPDSVECISNYAFSGCSFLTSIGIPESVILADGSAFDNCMSLTDISVDVNNQVYSSGDGILFNKDKTELIRYPEGKNGTTYVIPEGVTKIGKGAFEYCTSLTSIVIPESVTSIGDDAFSGCYALKSMVISESVSSIGDQAFFNCYSLKSIVIPKGVTYIGFRAFLGWMSGQTIYFCVESQPGGWHKDWAKLCDANIVWGYTGGTAPEPEPEVTDLQGVVYSLGYDETFYTVMYCDVSITSAVIPAEINGVPVKEIGNYAFEYRRSLVNIVIPGSVTSIGFGAFSGCTSLTEISVDVNNPAYSSGNGILFNKDKTELICYPAGKTETTYVIPEGVTYIRYSAFSGCTSLTEISVDVNNPAYSSSNGVLFDKDKTELICYPAGKAETTYVVPEGVTSINDTAFSNCTSLENIIIPESVTSIGYCAFEGCTSLESINIPEDVTYIDDFAFSDCTSLKNIIIPEGVTYIGLVAFSGCTSLKSIVIHDGVTYIGDYAFSFWTSEQTIYCVAESQPDGWSEGWAELCDANIVWGYKPEPSYTDGDINGDGTVTSADIVALAQLVASGSSSAASDVNGDGATTSADIVALAQIVAAG